MHHSIKNLIAAWEYINTLDSYPNPDNFSVYSMPRNFPLIDRVRQDFFLDEESLKIFDWFCQYRIVASLYGNKQADNMPNMPYTKEQWKKFEEQVATLGIKEVEGSYVLDQIDTWILESYSLPGKCEVLAGDVVLDCGAFTGNTSLYFAQKAGDSGRVYAFEPIESTFALLKKNTADHVNIYPINAAVSDKKQIVTFHDAGEASSQNTMGNIKALAFSIDEFCKSSKIDTVDFIKMDVEGGETEALKGAAEVIKKNAPKLAISVYHKETDLLTIPPLIHGFHPNYTYQLRHYSNTAWETVLYCY